MKLTQQNSYADQSSNISRISLSSQVKQSLLVTVCGLKDSIASSTTNAWFYRWTLTRKPMLVRVTFQS